MVECLVWILIMLRSFAADSLEKTLVLHPSSFKMRSFLPFIFLRRIYSFPDKASGDSSSLTSSFASTMFACWACFHHLHPFLRRVKHAAFCRCLTLFSRCAFVRGCLSNFLSSSGVDPLESPCCPKLDHFPALQMALSILHATRALSSNLFTCASKL